MIATKLPRRWLQAGIALLLAAAPAALHADTFYPAWVQEFDPGASPSQGAKAVAVDSHGHVIVTGINQKTFGGAAKVVTTKYDALDGHTIWSDELQATNEMVPTSVAVDSSDNVIVVGTRNNGDRDFFIMKYTAAGLPATGFNSGVTALPRSYDGTAGGEDVAVKVAIDGDDNIIVGGFSVGTGAQEDIYFRRLSPTGVFTAGNELRVNASNTRDKLTDLAIGPSNSIVVAGFVTDASSSQLFHVRRQNSNFTTFTAKSIDVGNDAVASSVAVNQATGEIYATGFYTDAQNRHGYYTVKLDSQGEIDWTAATPTTEGDFSGTGTSIALGPDGDPVVTGYLKDSSGTFFARTIKYAANPPGSLGQALWTTDDTGFISEDTLLRKVVVDGANNVIVLGESVNSHGPQSSSNNKDVYVAKYDGSTGERIFFSGFNGTFASSDDAGADPVALPLSPTVDLATDPLGNIILAASPRRDQNGTARTETLTLKFNRFIAFPGDELPDNITGVANGAVYVTGNAPSLGNTNVAARISYSGGTGILLQNRAGGTQLPAVKGGDAPGATAGSTVGKYVSFSDPVTAPSGAYAFPAKITGPLAQANGVWSTVSGALRLVLRQGTAVAGANPAANFSSATSLSMETGSLVALAKLSGPAASNTALLRVNAANAVNVLLRTGQSGLTPPGTVTNYTVKSITALTPAPSSPGDGRWHNSTGVIARVGAFATNIPKADLIVTVTNAGTPSVIAYTGQPTATLQAGGTFKSFGLPSLGSGVTRAAFLGTLNPIASGSAVTAANDTFVVYYDAGILVSQAREGASVNVNNLPTTVTWSAFSDPVLNANLDIAFLGTVKGTGVTAANNRALVFGAAGTKLTSIARTGDTAAAPQVDAGGTPEPATKYASFVSFALPEGATGAPVFISKLAGAPLTSNLGLFAMASDGSVRRLLRTGESLGGLKVKSFTLLKAVPKAFAASRSFNANNVVALAVTFTNNRTALLELGIP